MKIALKTLALVGGIAGTLALPQNARASDHWTCFSYYVSCIEFGGDPYACRDEYYLCRGMQIPVRDAGTPLMAARPE